MKVKIIYDDGSEEFGNVKQYTSINGDKKFMGLIMNGDKEIVYIRKEEVKRIEISKGG